jgi:hypothetical protein
MTDITPQVDSSRNVADVVENLSERIGSVWDIYTPNLDPIRGYIQDWFVEPSREVVGEVWANVWSDLRGLGRTSETRRQAAEAQQKERQEQADRIGGDYGRAVQTPEGQAQLERNFESLASRATRLSQRFIESFEQGNLNRRQREYEGVPLGFVQGMYQPVTDRDGQLVLGEKGQPKYRLLEWYRSPMEAAASRTAAETPERRQQQLAVGGQYAQAFSSPAGISMLERRMMGADYKTPFLTEDTVLTDSGAVNIVASMNTEQLNVLKNRLIQLDLLDADQAGTSVYADRTPATYDAFLTLVSKAQENGQQWEPFMDEALVNNVSFGRVSNRATSRAPALIRLTSKEDLSAVFNQTAQRYIGRRLMDDEIERLVTSYQSEERRTQIAMQSGGEVEMTPAADVFGLTQIQETIEPEYDTYQMGNTLDSFRRIIGGGG